MTTATNDAAVNDAAAPQKSGEPSSFRLVGTLLVAGLFSGMALVMTYKVTLPLIKANQEAALQEAVFKVVPGAASMRKLSLKGAALQPAAAGEASEVIAAFDKAGKLAGYAIVGEGPGFQDVIKLLFGYNPERQRITGMEILESRETPGLGDKIFKDPEFVANFKDLAVKPEIVAQPKGKKSAPHEIDAITGATISSKAVVKIINGANARWLEKLPAGSALPPPPPPPPQGGGQQR